jgi:hypothetical protein
MSKAHPPSRVKFLLCDDARAESSGKLTLVGLYPDDKILVQQNPAVPIQPPGVVALLNQLAIVCILFDGDGVFPASATITGPSGLKLADMPLGTPTFKAGAPGIMALQCGLFPVAQLGQYTCTVTVGKSDFRFPFYFLAGPAPTASVPTAPTKKKSRRKKQTSLQR